MSEDIISYLTEGDNFTLKISYGDHSTVYYTCTIYLEDGVKRFHLPKDFPTNIEDWTIVSVNGVKV